MEEEKTQAIPEEEAPQEKQYDTTPEAATNLPAAGPGWFNRKNTLIIIAVAFIAVVCGGFMFNIQKKSRKAEEEKTGGTGVQSPSFLASQRDEALKPKVETAAAAGVPSAELGVVSLQEQDGSIIAGNYPARGAAGSSTRSADPEQPAGPAWTNSTANQPASSYPPPPASRSQSSSTGGGGGGGTAAPAGLPSYYTASLVPARIEGSLFASNASLTGTPQPASLDTGRYDSIAQMFPYTATDPQSQALAVLDRYRQIQTAAPAQQTSPAAAQAVQAASLVPAVLSGQTPNTQPFSAIPAQANSPQNSAAQAQSPYDAGISSPTTGFFLGDTALWIGTIVPAVLVTAINTDLPGSIVARVSRNIYDSKTGKNLLIPQGTLIVAQYNSSISFAQSRVQIIWDTMIRPDGFMIDLGGMNAVDRAGMSGQEAVIDDHYFEYLKAAGIVALFSVANARMTEEVAKYGSDSSAGAVAEDTSSVVAQAGGSLVERAMSIQPTLTVASGSTINILLNKNIYLPPTDDYPAKGRYIRQR
jgi:type IV secretory pathway VirB10-like protein